jgi:acetyltransferase-like isoleucine patch superfamily enzyme
MINFITYIESVLRNVSSRWKGRLVKLYLIIHGCKVGKGLKCSGFPYFKGFPNKNVFIGDYVDLGRDNTFEIAKEGKIILEDYVLFHQNILISCNKEIRIKKWAALAENVSVRDGNHKFAKNEYYRKQEGVSEAIEIGEDAGVSAGCVVLMGARIAKGVFIGSNSVVTRKTITEEYGIYAGNPIKLIANRK